MIPTELDMPKEVNEEEKNLIEQAFHDDVAYKRNNKLEKTSKLPPITNA